MIKDDFLIKNQFRKFENFVLKKSCIQGSLENWNCQGIQKKSLSYREFKVSKNGLKKEENEVNDNRFYDYSSNFVLFSDINFHVEPVIILKSN